MKYATDTPADLVLDSFPFPSLVEANIQIYNDWNHERTYVSYIELYKKLSNAKLFKISGSSFQVWLINYLRIFFLADYVYKFIQHDMASYCSTDLLSYGFLTHIHLLIKIFLLMIGSFCNKYPLSRFACIL